MSLAPMSDRHAGLAAGQTEKHGPLTRDRAFLARMGTGFHLARQSLIGTIRNPPSTFLTAITTLRCSCAHLQETR
jgi:hypothetical protein